MIEEASGKSTAGSGRHAWWLGGYVLLLAGLAAFYYVLRLDLVPVAARYVPLARRIVVGRWPSC